MHEFEDDDFDDDELDTMAAPSLLGVNINAAIDAYLAATDPVSPADGSAFSRGAPPPPVPAAPPKRSMDDVFMRREQDKHEIWKANLLNEYCRVHGISMFARTCVRIAGEPPIEDRALAWEREGKPRASAKSTAPPQPKGLPIRFASGAPAPKPARPAAPATGQASVVRFAGGAAPPTSAHEEDDGDEPLARFIRLPPGHGRGK